MRRAHLAKATLLAAERIRKAGGIEPVKLGEGHRVGRSPFTPTRPTAVGVDTLPGLRVLVTFDTHEYELTNDQARQLARWLRSAVNAPEVKP
jgi:hypothetical protein